MAADMCNPQPALSAKQGRGIFGCSSQESARVNQFIAQWLESLGWLPSLTVLSQNCLKQVTLGKLPNFSEPEK